VGYIAGLAPGIAWIRPIYITVLTKRFFGGSFGDVGYIAGLAPGIAWIGLIKVTN
jgi:hypothetical protein